MYIREKEVENIIEGLKGESVTVNNLSEYFGKQCLFVSVHQRNQADKKVFISDILMQNGVSDETMEFFAEYKNKTQISIFPNQQMKKISSIFSSVRGKRNLCSFGRDGLMTVETYKESFRPFFEEKKEELNDAIQVLTNCYDTSVETFKIGFERMLTDVGVEDDKIKNITKEVYSKIPKKSELKNMFGISLELKAYPVVTSISLLDGDISEDVKDSISEMGIQVCYDILGTNLSRAFKQVNDLLGYYQKAFKFKDSDRKRIQILSATLAKDNLLKNNMISELSNDLKEYVNPKYKDDEIAELLEETLAKIYKFASETDTVDELILKNCVLDEADLKMYM